MAAEYVRRLLRGAAPVLLPLRAARVRQEHVGPGGAPTGAPDRPARRGSLPVLPDATRALRRRAARAPRGRHGLRGRDPAPAEPPERGPSLHRRATPALRALRLERTQAEAAGDQPPRGPGAPARSPSVRARRAGQRVRPRDRARLRQPPDHLASTVAYGRAPRLRADVPARGDPGGGSRAQPPGFRALPADRRALPRPDAQHRQPRARRRGGAHDGQRLPRDHRGHPPRVPAPGLRGAPPRPREAAPEALLGRCGDRARAAPSPRPTSVEERGPLFEGWVANLLRIHN